MSMLTPPGAGGHAPVARRRSRTLPALLSLVLLAGAVGAAWWWTHRDPDQSVTADPGPTCRAAAPGATTTPTPTVPAPAQVTVNVYNATGRAGLARSTAAELRRRGFRVAAVANDPLGRAVRGVAEVRSGPRGAAAAVTVQAQLGEGAAAVRDQRADASVDLVLGGAYQRLRPHPAPVATTASATPAGRC
jgi:hypothetical protein